jgi:hypothetical protein
MNNTSKKTSSFGFETKLSPDKVISTAVRFFSSKSYPKNYKVQSQGPSWVTFEPGDKKDKTIEQIICMIAAFFGFGSGSFVLARRYAMLNSFFGSVPPYHSRALLAIGVGIFCILLGIAAIVRVEWLSELSKLPQNITITVETLSSGTRVTIEHPSQKKVETLIGELIPLLPG